MAIFMVAGTTSTVMAQKTATATSPAGAKIVAVLTIANDQKLDFGTMSIPNADVQVTLTTSTIRNPDKPLNIALMSDPVLNAHYNVTGANGYLYNITFPTVGTTTIASGSNSMHIDAFTAKPKSRGTDVSQGTLDATTGKDDFVVGATLKLLSGQPAGIYTGSFDVVVAYN